MMIFHFVLDLRDFYDYNIDYQTGFFYLTGLGAKLLFITTAGISSTFSRNNLKRGVKLFAIAMILTIATYIYDPKMYINFGILHFLGISMIIYHYIKGVKVGYLVLLSPVIIIVGRIFATMTVASPYIFPLGLTSPGFSSLDYFPMFPWFGLFLLGVFLGKTVYKERKSVIGWKPKFDPISEMGKHSLTIYVAHQPIFLALLYLVHR